MTTFIDTSSKLPRELTWLAVGTFALGTESFVIAGILPQIADDFHIGRPTVGLLVLGARMIAAVFAAAFTPTASATASGLARPDQRGRALAMVFGGMSLAMIAGVPLRHGT